MFSYLFAQVENIDMLGLSFRVFIALAITAGALLIITRVMQYLGYGSSRPRKIKGSAKKKPSPSDRSLIGYEEDDEGIRVEQVVPINRNVSICSLSVDGQRMVVSLAGDNVTLLRDEAQLSPTHRNQAGSFQTDSLEELEGLEDGSKRELEDKGEPSQLEPPVTRLERLPISPEVLRAAQLRSKSAE